MTLALPIRIRLALWFFSIFAAATFAIGLLSVWMVHRTILELVDKELQQRVQGMEHFLASRPPEESLASLQKDMDVFDVTHGGKWLQVIDQDGQWLHRAKYVAAVFPTLALPPLVGKTRRYFEFKGDSRYVQGLIAVIHVHGRSYTVQEGVELNRKLQDLEDFRLHLIVLTPFVLFAAALVGYFASRRALTPVAAITGEARRISSNNLESRLPVLKTHDELADMSETLNRMLDRIDSGYRSVKEFTANAAHELRTPLSLMRAEAEIALAFERSASEYRTTLERIEAETIRMGKLVNHLLVLARSDAGVHSLSFEPLDLNEVVQSSANRWSPQLDNLALHLCLTPPAEDATIFADRSSIEQLLDILLENAQRYSPDGGRIQLSTSTTADSVLLTVADSGIGISPEHLDRIFERFYRVNTGNDGSAQSQGSGLGLALAARIAEIHGAKIEVRSKAGEGSCFEMIFKRLRGECDNALSNGVFCSSTGQPEIRSSLDQR